MPDVPAARAAAAAASISAAAGRVREPPLDPSRPVPSPSRREHVPEPCALPLLGAARPLLRPRLGLPPAAKAPRNAPPAAAAASPRSRRPAGGSSGGRPARPGASAPHRWVPGKGGGRDGTPLLCPLDAGRRRGVNPRTRGVTRGLPERVRVLIPPRRRAEPFVLRSTGVAVCVGRPPLAVGFGVFFSPATGSAWE